MKVAHAASIFLVTSAGCDVPPDVLYVGASFADATIEAGAIDGSPPSMIDGKVPVEAKGPDRMEAGVLDAVCTPAVAFENDEPDAGGRVFTDNVKNPTSFVQTLTRAVCPILYRLPSEPTPVTRITLLLAAVAPPTLGGTSGGTANDATITLNTPFLASYANTHTADETLYQITGLTAHLVSSLYQHTGAPLGVQSGVNDFVRYRLGYIPDSNRRKGGNWDDGYQTTAFFYVYLDDRYPDFVYKLNLIIGTAYSVNAFQVLTGKDVLTLWNEYQGSF
jgi:hypothetical protein